MLEMGGMHLMPLLLQPFAFLLSIPRANLTNH